MKKTCENCKYKDTDYSVYPCMDCFHKSKWEEWQDTNYCPTTEDFIIAELEKIKDKLEVAMWYNRRDKEYCLELIGKRISELKGEQE